MTAVFNVLVPFDRSPAIELGNGSHLWRKRLLPVGQVRYKDRLLHFTPQYLSDLAEAFRQHAYDQVPLQLAGADNRHTNDPERYAGEVLDAEAQPDGLWITLRATDRGNRVLAENPQLGISARIVEDYQRSDGASSRLPCSMSWARWTRASRGSAHGRRSRPRWLPRRSR